MKALCCSLYSCLLSTARYAAPSLQVSFLLLLLLNLFIALDPSALTTPSAPSSPLSLPRRHLRSSPLPPPAERRHVASLLRPMVPGMDHSPLVLWVGVLLAVAFHEAGHALAALVEGLQVRSETAQLHRRASRGFMRFGGCVCVLCSSDVGVYVAVLIPGAYVTLVRGSHRHTPCIPHTSRVLYTFNISAPR